MNKEQIDLLGEYIKQRDTAILIEEIPENIIKKGAVVLESNCSKEELMGNYKNLEYKLPKWYKELSKTAKIHTPILVIKDINKIPQQEQRKFIEILKYRKIYINKLPQNCVIFVTYKNLKENPIEEEIYSFLAHI